MHIFLHIGLLRVILRNHLLNSSFWSGLKLYIFSVIAVSLRGSDHQVLQVGGVPPPLPCPACGLGKLPTPPGRVTEPPLVKLYLVFLFHPPIETLSVNDRSTGCSGQAEMPYCLGVSSPRQVVPGLHLVFICLKVVQFFSTFDAVSFFGRFFCFYF